MFVAIIAITIVLALIYADWSNWRKYHATMLVFTTGNLFYNFVYHDHLLWRFRPQITNHHIMEIIYSFTVFPLTALMFLSNFPQGLLRQIRYVAMYVLIYFGAEFLLFKLHRIGYSYGWNIWWSLAWNVMMFPCFILHHKKPELAYIFVFALMFVMNWLFPYTLK
ncbi:MAG TPA: CBO0543 family protein [Bacillota bacterium]|nr:CBO0543 family protein [Bacillota bacterium]